MSKPNFSIRWLNAIIIASLLLLPLVAISPTKASPATPPSISNNAAGGGSASSGNSGGAAVVPNHIDTGTWVQAAQMLTATYRYAFASDGHYFYVISGRTSGGPNGRTTALQRYDPYFGSWSTLQPIPSAEEGAAAVYYNGMIYVAGGIAGAVTNALRIYNVAANSWSSGRGMPSATYGAAVGAYDGKVYVAGGFNTPNALQIYDIASGTWSTGATAPASFSYAGYTQVQVGQHQYLYIVGGYGTSPNHAAGTSPADMGSAAPADNSNATLRLDMATGQWDSGPTFTMQRADFALASDGVNLYAIGGDANGGTYFDPSSEVDQYNPSSWPGGSWTVNPNSLPAARQGNSAGFHSTTEAGGAIWSTGGLGGGITLRENLYLITVPPPATPTATFTPVRAGTSSPTPIGCANGASRVPHDIGLGTPGQVNVVHQPASQTGMRLSSGPRNAHATGRWSPDGTINFLWDDGSQEAAIGLNNNSTSYPAIWLNRFSPTSGDYPIHLSQISVQWPNPTEANVNLVGKTVDLLVYLDRDADNNPANATRIAQVAGQTITVADGVTFQYFTVDVTINGPGDLYIGFSDTYNHGGVSPQSYPAPLDTTSSQVRSWVAGQSGSSDPDYTNLGNNNLLGTIDGFGFAGNWAVRASGTTNSPCAATSTPQPMPTPPCPVPFVDINGNIFYTAIAELYCRGVVNGTDPTHYSPAGTSTRGQFAKVVVLGFGLPPYTPTGGGQDFTDVVPSYFAYGYIETGFHANILNGFDPNGCTAHGATYPCYLPNLAITRGQLTKLVVNAGSYALYTPTGGTQDFSDVPASNVFFASIETAYHNGIINGYPDGTFRPGNIIRRDEMAQIVYEGVLHRPNSMTATPTPCGGTDLVSNGGFETGSFSPWVIADTNPTPQVVTTQAHSGSRSAQVGKPFPGAPEPLGDSSIYQTVNVPAGGGTLSYWYWPYTTDNINFDWQDVYVENTNGTILATLMHTAENDQTWKQKVFDLGAYAGQTVRIVFLVHEDGYSGADNTGMYVDDVSLVSNSCATPAITVTGTPPTATPTPCGGPSLWMMVTPGPQDLYGAGATSDGNNAYFASGYRFSTGNETNQFARYNPSSGTWSTLAQVPNNGAVEMASAVYSPLNNKVYVFGGGNVAGAVYNDNRIYDVASGTWSVGAPMPDVRTFMASGYYNGKIYLVGGYRTSTIDSAQAQVWEYDVTANTYVTKTAMPHALGGAGYGVINGHLYVAGGRDATNNILNTLYDYNIAADSWATRSNLPIADNVPGNAVLNGKLYIFGGGNPFNHADGRAFSPNHILTTNVTLIYDPATGNWSNGPNMNTPRSFPAGTNVGNYAVTYGGYNGTTTVASAEILSGGSVCATPTFTPTSTPLPPTNTPTPCSGTPAWQSGPPLAPGRYAINGAVANDGNFYVVGGQTATNTPVAQLDRFNAATNTWTSLAPPPVAVGQAPVGAAGGKLYLAGGFLGVTSVTSTLQIYDIASNTWSFGPSMPAAVEAAAGVVLNGKFYVIGGDDFNNVLSSNYIYDIASNTWSTGTPLPAPRTNFNGTTANGLVYAFGGADVNFNATDILYSYDPNSHAWATLGSANLGGYGNYANISAYDSGKLLITDGGNTVYTPTNTTHLYTISSNTWSAGPAMIQPRLGHAQATLPDGRVIVYSGLQVANPPLATTGSELLPESSGCATPTATPTQCAGNLGPWNYVANYQIAIESPAVASVGTYIYSAAGFAGSAATNIFGRYDSVANTWIYLAPLPSAFYDARAVYAPNTNSIYVMGGYNGSTGLTSNYIYNISTNTWSSGAPLPAARIFPSLGYYNGNIYLAAGFDSAFSEQTAVWQYNPVANTWITTGFTSDPVGQGGAATAQIGQYLYLMGGYGGSASSFNERYDMAANTWATRTPLPAARYDGVGAALGGKVYVVGGGNPANNGNRRSVILGSSPASPDTTYSTTYVYDPGSDSWSSGPNLNTPRSYPAGTAAGNSIVMVGGFTGTADTNTVELATANGCGNNH